MTYTLPPCEAWATEADLCSPCNDYNFDSSDMEDFLMAASQVLYMASGQQFRGECTETIRPCGGLGYPTSWGGYGIRAMQWPGVCSCNSVRDCSCASYPVIELPHTPIAAITSVKVDGVTLASSRYRVDDYQYLVRLDDADGTNPGWPCCQDLLADPDSDDDTFEVTYTWGSPIPIIGAKAAGVLACELYMSCNPEEFPSSKCRLPRSIQQITRQGVSAVLAQLLPMVKQPGKPTFFNLPEVDMFLATYNPHGLTAPCDVFSPDDMPVAKRVGT